MSRSGAVDIPARRSGSGYCAGPAEGNPPAALLLLSLRRDQLRGPAPEPGSARMTAQPIEPGSRRATTPPCVGRRIAVRVYQVGCLRPTYRFRLGLRRCLCWACARIGFPGLRRSPAQPGMRAQRFVPGSRRAGQLLPGDRGAEAGAAGCALAHGMVAAVPVRARESGDVLCALRGRRLGAAGSPGEQDSCSAEDDGVD